MAAYSTPFVGKFVGGKIDLAGTDGNQDGHNLTITAGDGNVTLTEIGGTSSEVVDIEGATITATIIGNADEIKSVKLDGSTKVVLGGDITTSNTTGNNVDIDGPAELSAAITIDTKANNGSIDFDGKIDSSDATNRNLTLKTKDGAVSIGGLIGSTNDLGNLKIVRNGSSGESFPH